MTHFKQITIALTLRANKMLIMSSDQSPSLDDLTDENACICCHNVSMVCPGANHMVCPAALATPMVLLTRVVAPKVCPQMKQPGRHVQAYALTQPCQYTRTQTIVLFLSHLNHQCSPTRKLTSLKQIDCDMWHNGCMLKLWQPGLQCDCPQIAWSRRQGIAV